MTLIATLNFDELTDNAPPAFLNPTDPVVDGFQIYSDNSFPSDYVGASGNNFVGFADFGQGTAYSQPLNVDLSGYENITFSCGFFAGLTLNGPAWTEFYFEYRIGAGAWTQYAQIAYTKEEENPWNLQTFNLPAECNNQADFSFRLKVDVEPRASYYQMDDWSFWGDPIPVSAFTPKMYII